MGTKNTAVVWVEEEPKNPEYGQFAVDPFFGDYYYWNGKKWVFNEILEDDGSIFEIVRLQRIPSSEEFELVMQ